jgi:predicted nucleotidyltransferase
MRERIVEALKGLERKLGIHILFACEYKCRKQTGPPSDFTHHVRFIFVRPLNQQLCIVTPVDQYYQVNDGKVEIYGLDLRKALIAVWISDSSIFEWMDSEEVYLDKTYFSKSLKGAIPVYFSPKVCMQRYYQIAQKIYHTSFGGTLAPLGSIYAIIYNLLLCAWIKEHTSVPPYDICKLRTLIKNPLVQQALNKVLKDLENHPEADLVICAQPISAWIEEQLSFFRNPRGKPQKIKDAKALDGLYQHMLSAMGANPLYLLHLN